MNCWLIPLAHPAESSPDVLTDQQRDAIAFEIADIFIFLVRMADILSIDLPSVANLKLDLNEGRFPSNSV